MSTLILTYHGVERRAGPLFVDPALFAEQLDAIVASGLPVLTIGEVAAQLGRPESPRLAVALTFDDGFSSLVEQAAPLLVERELRATVFCVAGRLGGSSAWPSARGGSPSVPLAGARELAELARAGFEIGGHGMDHAPLDTDDAAEIRREVTDARVVLEQAVGTHVTTFAYPYGAPPSPAARQAVAESYVAACTTRIARAGPEPDPHALPRVDAHYVGSPERLDALIHGRADTYLVARRLAAGVRRRLRTDYSR